jgi:type II secretory pathway component PulF
VPVYKYKATNSEQAAVSGTVAADTPRQARDTLRARGLLVQRVVEHGAMKTALFRWPTLFRSRSTHSWTIAVHELSMLLRGGIPLVEALDTIAQQHRGHFHNTLMAVRDRVSAGRGLAEALAERPDDFDALTVHLVEVGEHAGTLEDVLQQLAEFKQRMLQLKDQVLTALLYPSFLLVFGMAATIFLMTYVMPPLLENLQESLDTLPWPTRVVKGCSDLLVNYGVVLGIVAALLLIGLTVGLRTRRGRLLWHRALLRVPLLGTLALKQSIARTAMVISTLSRSGVVLTKALELAARSSDNLVLQEALEECGNQVGAGRDISTSLRETNVFPPLAVQIFSVGQETGRLEEMLDQLSMDYNRQVTMISARFAALLEPVLILLLAGLVGFVLLATVLPILEAGNVL